MLPPQLQERLSAYRRWRTRLARGIAELGHWLEQNQVPGDEAHTWVRAALATLDAERLNVVFLSAGGRGAADLINALFFHDKGRRLLPSYAGRKETCPIEVCWDAERDKASLHLLPIETLSLATPFRQLRADPAHWVSQPIAVTDPQQTAQQLRQVNQTKTVPRADAVRLGVAQPHPGDAAGIDPVEIPKWRYAIVSFPNSLLRLGLTVFAIPDLGRAQVAADLLTQAQLVVCVLAADQEDATADLHRWRRHFSDSDSGSLPREAVVVALEQPDQQPGQEEDGGTTARAPVGERRRAIAAALGIDPAQVFPLSAQMALRARAGGDLALLQYTGIPVLETYIANALPQAKRKAQADALMAGLSEIVNRNRVRAITRIDGAKVRLRILAALRDKQNVLIAKMVEQTGLDHDVYVRSVQRFQADRDELALDTKRCREILDRDQIDTLIGQTHTRMARSWTTIGMVGAMMGLFDELRRAMQTVATESERIRKRVRATYEGFRRDFGFELTLPNVFAPMKFRVEIELLHQDVEAFLHNPGLVLTEQGVVIKRFHETLISRVQVLFDHLRAAFDIWTRDTLQPLADHIERYKIGMGNRLDDLQRLERSNADTQRHIEQTQAQYVELARQLAALRNIQAALRQDLDAAGIDGPSGTPANDPARKDPSVV
jgi:hypothetical protein